jgi:hypothetical protein
MPKIVETILGVVAIMLLITGLISTKVMLYLVTIRALKVHEWCNKFASKEYEDQYDAQYPKRTEIMSYSLLIAALVVTASTVLVLIRHYLF